MFIICCNLFYIPVFSTKFLLLHNVDSFSTFSPLEILFNIVENSTVFDEFMTYLSEAYVGSFFVHNFVVDFI